MLTLQAIMLFYILKAAEIYKTIDGHETVMSLYLILPLKYSVYRRISGHENCNLSSWPLI